MVIEATVGQVYFYILCRWIVIALALILGFKALLELFEIIRIYRITQGPCSACKRLEDRVQKLEGDR